MKMMTFWTLSLSAVLLACGGGNAENGDAASAKTEAAATETAGNDVVSPKYKNGINEQNAGDKKGKVKLSGTIAGLNGGTLTLYETEGRNKSEVAKVPVRSGAFDFGAIEISRGFYVLGLDEQNTTEIILNPDEPAVTLEFKTGRLSGAKTAANSQENAGWFAYQSLDTRNKNEVRALRQNAQEASGMKAQIDQQIAAKDQELIAAQHAMIDQYPGTYLAKILSLKNPKYPQSQSRFFEELDPMDGSLVRSMTISDRIQGMMIGFSGGKDPGFMACIDQVKAHFEPNPVTLESALYSMLDGFYNTGKEHICQYILDNYIFDDDCGADLSDAIRIRAQGIINLQVGKTPPNFRIPKWNGGEVDLRETCAKNQYTLVMFWASWCHKCEQEMPYVGPLYQKYKAKGFEVIVVSLDNNRQTWEKAIADNGATWPNVSQLMAWSSPVVADYKITATPTYFLLDKQGNIVLKPQRAFEVDNFLAGKLK